jgi:diadenosine tetraphosphate (Ap4A) HIT family hydrolase
MSCTFCSELHTAGALIYQDDRTWVLLHPDWSPRGHAMVVSKRHVENASSLHEQDWLHLAHIWHHAERVLLDVTGAERAIILKLGIATPHLHMHIYPMSAGATREEVFAAIDGRASVEHDGTFIDAVKRAMSLDTPFSLE